MEAHRLAVGETVRTRDGSGARVLGLERLPGVHAVFNLEVEGLHPYHVSPLGLLAHNNSKCETTNTSAQKTKGANEAAEAGGDVGKPPPSPNGKKGSQAHQDEVDAGVADMKSRVDEVKREVKIETPGGKKEIRFMDAVGYKDGKAVEVLQVGRGLKSNPMKPVARERDAYRDVRNAPELKGAKRTFRNYNKRRSNG